MSMSYTRFFKEELTNSVLTGRWSQEENVLNEELSQPALPEATELNLIWNSRKHVLQFGCISLKMKTLNLKATEVLLKGPRFPGCHSQEFSILINTNSLTEEALCRTFLFCYHLRSKDTWIVPKASLLTILKTAMAWGAQLMLNMKGYMEVSIQRKLSPSEHQQTTARSRVHAVMVLGGKMEEWTQCTFVPLQGLVP